MQTKGNLTAIAKIIVETGSKKWGKQKVKMQEITQAEGQKNRKQHLSPF